MARDWRYCAYCGLRIERPRGIFGSIDKMVKGMLNSLFNNKPSGKKVTVRFRTGPQRTKQKVMKLPKELVEPKAEIKRVGDDLEITIELPGIKSLNHVNLMHMGESLEVRAVIDDKGYFKIISVPEDYRIASKEVSNEKLLVRMRSK
jgi:HSP20 family molecular chaperone IbpA